MSKVITVFGATGNQGGSVITSLLADPAVLAEYRVRGVTRDVSKPASQRLTDRGVEMVPADMGSAEDTARAVAGSHTVFFVTNYWESMSRDKEVAQGKMVTDACVKAGVKHIIFSSLIDVTKATKGRLPNVEHFDGKAEIERYIRNSGVAATFVMPGFFMSNFFGMMKKGGDGSFTFSLPVSGDKARVPMFDAANDTGKFVRAAVKHFPQPSGANNILAASAYLSPEQIVAEFTEVTDLPAKYQRVSADEYRAAQGAVPPNIAQELLENMLLLEEPGYYAGASLEESLALLDEKPTTWREFVAANRGKWE